MANPYDFGGSGPQVNRTATGTTASITQELNNLRNRVDALEKGQYDPKKPNEVRVDGYLFVFVEGSGYSARGAASFKFDEGYFEFFDPTGFSIATYTPSSISVIKRV